MDFPETVQLELHVPPPSVKLSARPKFRGSRFSKTWAIRQVAPNPL